MRFQRSLLLVTLLSVSVPAYADLVTFNSLAAFTTAAPELRVETFEIWSFVLLKMGGIGLEPMTSRV